MKHTRSGNTDDVHSNKDHHILTGVSSHPVNVWPDNASRFDCVAQEVAIALVYNGVSHAVMMASPNNLEAFILGFSFNEGIIEKAQDIFTIEVIERNNGIEVHAQLCQRQWHKLKTRKRNLYGTTGCGICGTQSLDMLQRDLPAIKQSGNIADKAIQKAIGELHKKQHIQGLTGAAHAAAWCDNDGDISHISEDVGRHNALDKLIGTLLQNNAHASGFVLITSRISFEMVQKCIAYGAPLLAGISAPTSLAIELAQKHNLTLVDFARPGRHTIYTRT